MKFYSELRKKELLALIYRIGLAYFFYQFARFLFWWFNKDLIKVDSISDYFSLAFHGLAFDTTAILYTNALFILLSILPLVKNTSFGYQKFLKYLYFITNGLAFVLNFIDFIYYKFSQQRLTSAAIDVAKNENNGFKVMISALSEHFMVPVFYVLILFFWVFLYNRVKVDYQKPNFKWYYFFNSFLIPIIVAVLSVGGIRGDFKHSTRPINLVDANKFVKNPLQANIVLNSVFSFLRTINTNNFKLMHFVDEKTLTENVSSVKIYPRNTVQKPNIVIFIVESFGREYSGAFNKNKNIPNYVSYTPFIDSLANESLLFPNSFANGRQSIHGMSSILSGIPTLKDAFTSSPYSNQKIQSIVSICNDLDYDTSFYHGAPNGSMGFLGFGNILGFKNYFGKTEYNNDRDFDGIWGIWDLPFLQYFGKNIGKKQPFMSTVFTVSSHHPFKIPEKFIGKFQKGPLEMHEPIQYTDYSIRKFFETAKKQSWYNNTIFVITGDHTNQTYYPEYSKAMNRFAVPILFFSPNKEYNLKGVNQSLAQQIDIFPTLVDLIGYNKSFRSWGRSLVSDKMEEPLIINSTEIQNFMYGNYIYLFDGKDFVGLYDKEDLGLEKNLLNKVANSEIENGKIKCKSWYQDYMYRIINKKLDH